MREKKHLVVITFHTTSAAMAMEKLCQSRGLPGRLIPAPRAITSDCGIAWSAPWDQRDVLLAVPDLPERESVHEIWM